VVGGAMSRNREADKKAILDQLDKKVKNKGEKYQDNANFCEGGEKLKTSI